MGRGTGDTALRAFLFADLRDYTAFVEREGDRAAAELIAEYRALIRSRLPSHEGAELKTEGDSFYIVFPSPSKAIEFAADVFRAAREGPPGRRLKFGIGIHVGETVPLDGQFVGSAVNIAARIGAIAGDGELLVTDTVRGLVRTNLSYPFEDRGPTPLKGVAEPIHVFAVDWAPRSTPQAAPPHAPPIGSRTAAFVGRDAELDRLARAATALRDGRGGTVLLGGAAGLGKSRLLREWTATSGVLTLVGECGATDARPPYEPFRAMLRHLTQAAGEEARLRRLAPDLLVFLPELETGERARHPDRDALFGAMLRLLRDLARGAPIAIVIEDLHWTEEGSLAMFRFLSGVADTAPFLLIGTYRDDELPRGHPLRPIIAELTRRPDAVDLHLLPLGPAESLRLLRSDTAPDALQDGERDRIIELAEGNPLCLEELARSAGDPGGALPLTIAEAVVRRVGTLDEDARRLVLYAAVRGQHAGFDLLSRVLGTGERDLLRPARTAIEASLLTESGDGLTFRHALTREAVYRDMMKRERRLLHEEVANALIALHGDDASMAADIERQLIDAGQAKRAIPYALAAGGEALRLLAADEAAAHFERAVDAGAPGSIERAQGLEGLGNAYRHQLKVSKAVATLGEAVEAFRASGMPRDVARCQAALARSLPFGPRERAAWVEAWHASETHGSPAELSVIATNLADRASEALDDTDAARWIARARELVAAAEARGRAEAVEETLLAIEHPVGWHVRRERALAKRLDQAIDRDELVLTAYRRYIDSRSREAAAEERQALLARARAYAIAHGIGDRPRMLTFRSGPPWMLWLAGDWDELVWLWTELKRQFGGDDIWEIFPDTGPLDAAVRLEREGPGAAGAGLRTAVEHQASTGTWHARVASSAHLANLDLAEGRAPAVVASLRTLAEARSPQAMELPLYLLSARVVAAAAMFAGDADVLAPWLAIDSAVRSEGAMFAAAIDHLRAIDHLLGGRPDAAADLLRRAAATYAALGWDHLAAELAWQRARAGDHAGLEAAREFYRARNATWRLRWLEDERWR
ncbi:MAG TPA: AAA family ATPase [Candidatus Limnocylindria bacterium]|nr:AAA family ATPase [Candidatus Limnocylindria bacterium]